MDPASLIGLVVAFGVLFGVIVLDGANIASIFLPGPLLLVFGASIAVTIASSTLPDTVAAFKALPTVFTGRVTRPGAVIDDLVRLAETARRDGVLALEQEADRLSDPFLSSSLRNVADGMDSEELRMLMEDEIDSTTRGGSVAARFFTTMGGYAPTIGIIGTVVSLTHVLENLSDPQHLGGSIAAAFVATLWGVLSANFIWIPIGNRLARMNELETERMMLILEGLMGIQSGAQPRILGERLRALVVTREAKGRTAPGVAAVAEEP